MQRTKFLYTVLETITVIIVTTGCSMSSTPLIPKNSRMQQDNVAINNKLENEDIFQFDEDITEAKGEIILNEWGYTYSSIGNTISSIRTSNNDNILNSESGKEGKDEVKSETILQWSDAQKVLDIDKLYWLNNEYLNSYAEDISYIISDNDIIIAKYLMQTSKVNVYVFTVSKDDRGYFEFRRNYTSELYDIRQINEGYIWQCFSYNGYDDTEYTSAVLADKNMVYEITFENCDENFISNTLAAY